MVFECIVCWKDTRGGSSFSIQEREEKRKEKKQALNDY